MGSRSIVTGKLEHPWLYSIFNRYEENGEGFSRAESNRVTSLAGTAREEEEELDMHQKSDEASAGFISHIRIQHSGHAKLRVFKERLGLYQ